MLAIQDIIITSHYISSGDYNVFISIFLVFDPDERYITSPWFMLIIICLHCLWMLNYSLSVNTSILKEKKSLKILKHRKTK